jgi:hypothetical protein
MLFEKRLTRRPRPRLPQQRKPKPANRLSSKVNTGTGQANNQCKMRSCECFKLSTSTSPLGRVLSGPQTKNRRNRLRAGRSISPLSFRSLLPLLYVHGKTNVANEPLLPGIEGHRPWYATYKAPSHTSASIKVGNFSPSSARSSTGSDGADERTRRTERKLVRRRQQASRLTRARESILDYRLGINGGGDGQRSSTRINPVTLKGWQSLVDARIEVHQRLVRSTTTCLISVDLEGPAGRSVQPIAWLSEERNPFVAREELLMVRIVQCNGATPPWVEIQMG